MGGGNFVVPVQTVPDFLENKLSGKIMDHYHVPFICYSHALYRLT